MEYIYVVMEPVQSNEGFEFEELYKGVFFKSEREAEQFMEQADNPRLFIKKLWRTEKG